MTTNNYAKEEEVKDTPITSLDNYDAALKSIRFDVKGVKEWRADTEAFLGALYQEAQQAGDQTAMNNIMITWDRDQKISDDFIKMLALQKSLRKMAQQLIQGSMIAHDTLEALEEAIADADEAHPALNDFAYEIRKAERIRIFPMALEKATMAVMQEFYDKIHFITGTQNTEFKAIHRLMDLLTQQKTKPSDLQRALIVELLNTCAEDIAKEEAASGQ